ncbi:MAG: hypothetical protein ACFBWO_06715 [Paracoccaceae bacterium]
MREAPLGWLTSSPQAALAFLAPEILGPDGLARRIVLVRASFDLRVRLRRAPGRPPAFERVAGGSRLTEQGFRGLVTPILPEAQRETAVPACQISLNLHLVSDEPARVQLTGPYLWPGMRGWPGTLIAGRFPVRDWPRPLNAILEWHDPERDWVLKRGDPLAYMQILYDAPELVPRLVEVARTPALARHIERLDLVSEVARNVSPMFERAAHGRPARLVVPKRGEDGTA